MNSLAPRSAQPIAHPPCEPPDNGRRAVVVMLAGTLAICALIAAAIAWPTIDTLAYAGVITVGTITGAAVGALARIDRRGRR